MHLRISKHKVIRYIELVPLKLRLLWKVFRELFFKNTKCVFIDFQELPNNQITYTYLHINISERDLVIYTETMVRLLKEQLVNAEAAQNIINQTFED